MARIQETAKKTSNFLGHLTLLKTLHYSQAFYDKKKLVFAQFVLVAYMRKSGANVFC